MSRRARADERAIYKLVSTFGCTAAYLDVGSNIGVQIRKLFEPHHYRGALATRIFRDVGFRDEMRCRVCAIGIEPNPHHSARLDQLEQLLQAASAPALVLRGAANVYDGEQNFFMHANATLDVGANSGLVHPRKMREKCKNTRACGDESYPLMNMATVRAIDLARIFKVVARALSLQRYSEQSLRRAEQLSSAPPMIIAKLDVRCG